MIDNRIKQIIYSFIHTCTLNEVDNFSFEIDYKTTAYGSEYNTFWQINIKENGRANIYKIFKNNMTTLIYDYSE